MKLITCPYCGTELEQDKVPFFEHVKCIFCDIYLGPDSMYGMYAENGKRARKERLDFVVVEEIKKPLRELLKLHTADLLQLLKLARTERAAIYNQLRIFNKAEEHNITGYEEVTKEQGAEYETWTKYCRRIENILIERLGYYPEKITENLLAAYEEKCKKFKNKSMEIVKERKKVKN